MVEQAAEWVDETERQRPTEKNCISRISTCRMEENAMTPAQAQAVVQFNSSARCRRRAAKLTNK